MEKFKFVLMNAWSGEIKLLDIHSNRYFCRPIKFENGKKKSQKETIV